MVLLETLGLRAGLCCRLLDLGPGLREGGRSGWLAPGPRRRKPARRPDHVFGACRQARPGPFTRLGVVGAYARG